MYNLKVNSQLKPCIMEGYSQYLIYSKGISHSRVRLYINSVRKFFNHVGKSYLDIEGPDIQVYLSFLKEEEHLQESTLYRHLIGIKRFYEYLRSRGDIVMIPSEGVSIKSI